MDRIISHIFGLKKVKIKSYQYEVDVVEHDCDEIYLSPRLQNVYLGDEVAEEPDFRYVPESSVVEGIGASLAAGAHQQGSVTCSSQNNLNQGGGKTHALSQSMMLLEESLMSGAIIGQFEQLYRRYVSLYLIYCCHILFYLQSLTYQDSITLF